MTAGFVEFEFNLPDALLQSLIAIFDGMEAAPLLAANVTEIPNSQGVYQLLRNGKIVYIGKTDSDAGLRQRLSRHSATIRHRKNLPISEMTFKAVRVFVFTAMDLETELIRHYSKAEKVAWNNSGFGSNDPGRNRDNTKIKEGHFDAQFPIDLDEEVDVVLTPGITAAAALNNLRGALPYTVRFEGEGRTPHLELRDSVVKNIPKEPRTTQQVVSAVIGSLPPSWQATLLAGRVIVYKEDADYTYGTTIAKSPTR